ncbi:MAG: hypothetical protein KJ949_01245 [Nanoarchaeota archaeon]|nr:hypothetical protein [Nanoarchaeota archaeon]MBU4308228.1 hypothetical protein [Nanoarchaeota archaeon]
MNKRGQGLSTSAIILIILGVVILALLIFGFSTGWKSFSKYLQPDEDNVQTIVTSCELACSSQAIYDYCTKQRELEASNLPTGDKSVMKTCNQFATEVGYESYGISECSAIDC